jgi:hypothetical protein
MNTYDPIHPQDSEEWLAIDESQRISLVEDYHAAAEEGESEGSPTMHAAIHVVVENQVAGGEDSVSETVARLIRQGLDRHEAIHAVGAVLSEDIFHLLKGSNKSWDTKKFARRFEKLTAKGWRKGKW